jgi:WD40 repeat protein
VLSVVAAVGTATFIFLIVVMVWQGLDQAGVWAGPLAALAGIVAAGAAVWVTIPPPSKVLPPPELEVPDWVVDRPAELEAVVTALVGGKAGTVGITTGLYGAGGFGKTTLAQMVCADRRVRQSFGGRVHLVTVGRDMRGATAIAAKVNDVIKDVAYEEATFTDPQLAGRRLGSLLDAGPRRLIVLDDVWTPEQLVPFVEGGKRCARLVTTRVPELLAGRGVRVRVDQMSPEQARTLLMSGLQQLDAATAQGLLAVTGRWPLLLRLVNKILVDYARVAADVSTQAAALLEQLAAGGPAVVDELLGDGGRVLDVGQPQQRARAVRSTIEASTGLLDHQDAERFTELGVFAADESIPFSLVTRLWRATAGIDDLRSAQVTERLAQLALVSQASGPAGGIAIHNVIRDFLRAGLGQQRLADLNAVFLNAVAASLPAASPLHPAARRPVRVTWWDLGYQERYLWDHLIEHLVEARWPGEAEALASDLRWAGARLERFGPAALAADLAAAGTPRATRLRDVIVRAAHMLTPTEPIGAVVDVFYSRVADDPDWGPQVAALDDIRGRPRLVNRWPVPDTPDPALQRVLVGHLSGVSAVAVAPDGSWLASGSWDHTVRIWDAASGRERAVLTGHTGRVSAVAVAPDGSWLASGGLDDTVRIWDAATGRERAVLTGHTDGVQAVAVAPDGSWLASGGLDDTVRIWDAASGRERAVLTGHTSEVNSVAVAPDGSWLASGGLDDTVRIWDAATGRERAVLTGHTGRVSAVAVAPDGSWLASGSVDRSVRIWDVASGREKAVLTGHTDWAVAVAVAPDGGWLASGGLDVTVRIWDLAAGREKAVLTGHTSEVNGVAVAPDGSWLASGGLDETVRIWDAASGRERAVLTGHTGRVWAVAVAPDGSWLASGSWDETVRIWDMASGRERAVLTGHTDGVQAVAVAPDGSWLVSGSRDKTVRIWDAATGREKAVLTGHTGVVNGVAVAPDGSWLASGGQDDTVRIWDVASGRERAVLISHAYSVAVALDGSWLASAGDDESVRIWDVATWQERAVLTGYTQSVTAVAVAPDGRWLATAGFDKVVRIRDTVTWRVRALMRVDGVINVCAWLGSNALVVGGSAGLYLFGLVAQTSPAVGSDGTSQAL